MAFTENQSAVAELYIASLGRSPDYPGLNYWVGRLEGTIADSTTLTLEEIQATFFDTNIPEVAARFPEGTTSREYVESIYVNVFARVSDEGGLDYWSNRLDLPQADENYLSTAALMSTMLEIAKDPANSVDGATLATKLSDAQTTYDSEIATISAITIEDGNFTPGAVVDILVSFNKNISVVGVDSTLTIKIGENIKKATYDSKTSNSITYKYTVEDGISDSEQKIFVEANAIDLNNSTIKDMYLIDIDIANEVISSDTALVSDNKAPSIVVNSASYTSTANKLVLNGTGFLSILEQSENSSTDVSTRFDMTKLIWDIDGDYDTVTQTDGDPLVPNVNFTLADVSLIRVMSDTEISIVFATAFTSLESATNYGHGASGTLLDTLDILAGFVEDKVGNISTDAIKNNILIGIDSVFWGTNFADIITGTTQDDTIYGQSGSNTIYGKEGNDKLYGGNGNDILVGGLGIDILSGGAGSDTFLFKESTTDSVAFFTSVEGIDTITDLVLNGSNGDFIDLEGIVTKVNPAVSGKASQSTFIADMNRLLSVPEAGFDTVLKDFSATLVTITDGDLSANRYLVVDVNSDNIFTKDDFIVNVTGVVVSNFDTSVFV